MGLLVGWIEALEQAAEAVEVAKLFRAMLEDPALLGVLPLYLLAFARLAHRWTTRRRPRRRRISQGLRLGAGLLHLLGAVALLALGLILAVARAAGRSTFHSGARF